MTEESPSRTISLGDVGQKYTEALQHLSDLAVFAWAGARAVNEQGYEEAAHSVPGLPVTSFRFSFEAAKAAAALSGFKHSINEVLGLVTVFLEDIRKLSGLVVFNAARARGDHNLATLAAQLNVAPSPDLPGRFRHLRERIGMELPLEAEILSIATLAGTLFHRNGLPMEGETLSLRLKVIQPPANGSTEAQAQARLGDHERSWKAGERVTLSRQEHAAIFTTVSLFFNATLGAVQEFAKRSGLAPEPAAQ